MEDAELIHFFVQSGLLVFRKRAERRANGAKVKADSLQQGLSSGQGTKFAKQRH